jgi:hypothetical protein
MRFSEGERAEFDPTTERTAIVARTSHSARLRVRIPARLPDPLPILPQQERRGAPIHDRGRGEDCVTLAVPDRSVHGEHLEREAEVDKRAWEKDDDKVEAACSVKGYV